MHCEARDSPLPRTPGARLPQRAGPFQHCRPFAGPTSRRPPNRRRLLTGSLLWGRARQDARQVSAARLRETHSCPLGQRAATPGLPLPGCVLLRPSRGPCPQGGDVSYPDLSRDFAGGIVLHLRRPTSGRKDRGSRLRPELTSCSACSPEMRPRPPRRRRTLHLWEMKWPRSNSRGRWQSLTSHPGR